MGVVNLCAGLDIKERSFEETKIGALYSLQQKLQSRLGQGLTPQKETPSKLIFWRHCIHSECDELLEWFDKPNSPERLKEARMEAIDVLHFIFNLGITLRIEPEEVQELWENTPVILDTASSKLDVNIKIAVCELSNRLTDFIDCFPWKTWKKYDSIGWDMKEVQEKYAHVLGRAYALCYLLDMHEQKIGEYFIAKNEENHARQDRGY